MKKFTLLLAIIIQSLFTVAQTPQAINYQAVARTVSGDPIVNQDITVKLSILEGSANGTPVYSEVHDAITNSFGLFTLQVGKPGLVLTGDFEDIAWGVSDYFVEVELDENGGISFIHLGTSQILAVPYALWSENTANPEDADADPTNELQTLAGQDYELSLSQGGGTFNTGIKSYTQAEVDAMAPYNGLTVHNATTNCINYYYLNNWFEACGTCTPMPSIAMAGDDQVFNDETTQATLAANTPEQGIGLWTVVSGEGGYFEDNSNPVSLFTGQHYVEYTLQWAISTACDTTTDEVNVGFTPWLCGLPFFDNRDSKTYQTVQIDDQCWMAENLAYLPVVSPSSDGNNIVPYFYVYNYQGTIVAEAIASDNYQNYGALYNWTASLFSCPAEWHLPTDAEWAVLTDYLGGTVVAGGKMKSIRTDPDPHPRWNSLNIGATNSSGFSGFPGGYRDIDDGTFYDLGIEGVFWSSTEYAAASGAWVRKLGNGNNDVNTSIAIKSSGNSVRCLRDL